ncbi:pyridoxal phosphate-dependent transferase [Kalaharituber pfeilii]|nr:pyridoxal phosphate-dependent transferase [Kalaharituber pfeilii]
MASSVGLIRPAARVASQSKDVWTTVNEAASECATPVINLGQGFFGYNPPDFILKAAKEAMDRVDCNQYAPTKGRLRLRKALSGAYSPHFGRTLDPDTEIVITSGANEGMLSAFMGFVEQGDEVIVMEPFFDQYVSNIQMAGGKLVYVPLHPPKKGATEVCPASEWKLNIDELKAKITEKTRMIVLNTPHNPIGKVFTREELEAIGKICVENNIIILSDEVYDRLYYMPFTRIATLSPEISRLTITVGSAGKNFYATGWRVGWLIGEPHLIRYCTAAHTRICFSSVSPLQEAAAIGFEQADAVGFWETSKNDMQRKMDLFNEIWDELGVPYTKPDGGYFVLVNLNRLQLPPDYPFPEHVLSRARDFRLCWWLIKEIGVAAIPPTEFYTRETEKEAEDYLRFAVCKEDEVLEAAKERLRKLKAYLK